MNEAKNEVRNAAVRIDRWLWFARFYRTRGLAAAAVSGGHVKLNGERAKPGNRVNQGDSIELVRDKLPYSLTAGPLPTRRGPAHEAQQCYTEDESSVIRRRQIVDGIRQDRRQMPRTDGKPDKHTRRKLRERNRGDSDTDR